MSSEEKLINESIRQFSTALYGKILEEQNIDQEQACLNNTFISPLSLFIALSMTEAGSAGVTKDELTQALRLPPELDRQQLYETIGSFLTNCFTSTEGVDTSVANRLFVTQQAEVLPNYTATLAKYFNASTESLIHLPDNEAKRGHINQWVAKLTKDLIRDLLPAGSVSADTVMALVNALYFRGFWSNKFDPDQTQDAPFHAMDGSTIDVKMMSVQETFSVFYLQKPKVQVVRMAFKDENWEMVVAVPSDRLGLPTLLLHLREPNNLAELVTTTGARRHIRLSLPRFTIGDELPPLNMVQTLSALGIKALFNSGQADLSGICTNPPLSVSDVFHKALLQVDEEGATAAAASAMIMTRCRIVPVTVDHPFFVAIVYKHSVPVFMGHVLKPNSK